MITVQYYREKAREAEKKEIPTFGRGGPLPVRKQNVGLLMVMAAAIGAVAFWDKNRKTGERECHSATSQSRL